MPQTKKATVPSLAEGVRIFKTVSAAKLQTLTDAFDAIDMLERLMIHSSRDPKQRTISYRPAVEALTVIAKRRGVTPPAKPRRKVTLRDARDLLGDLRVRLQDRSDPEYWEWRFAQVGMNPGRFAIDHLAGMGLIEGADTQKNVYGHWYTLSRQRARQYVHRVMHEMVAMERWWARRRGIAVDYQAAAQAIERVVAAATGRKVEDASGLRSARQLIRFAQRLRRSLADPKAANEWAVKEEPDRHDQSMPQEPRTDGRITISDAVHRYVISRSTLHDWGHRYKQIAKVVDPATGHSTVLEEPLLDLLRKKGRHRARPDSTLTP